MDTNEFDMNREPADTPVPENTAAEPGAPASEPAACGNTAQPGTGFSGSCCGNYASTPNYAGGNVPPMGQMPNQQWSYSYGAPNAAAAAAPVKKHRKGGKALIAVLMAACILLSGLAGFAGSWYANRLSGPADNDPVPGAQIAAPADKNISHIRSESTYTYADLAAKVTPTVVQVTTEYTIDNFWMQQTATGAGSGVIITEDGTIVTNNHVVENATTIRVILSNGDKYDAKLIATDPQSDIAVLKIEASGLPFAEVGNSDDLVVGQEVIAVGNPLGVLGGTVTNGIISATEREITVENNTMSLIQTNTAINSGNSGGGLFDAAGHLIGIVNAKYSDTGVEGLGFAIPINVAMKSAQDLIDVGYVTGRVSVGLNLIGIHDEQTAFQYRVSKLGVYVYSTVEGSSAEKAGFRTGDYIVSIDGEEVSATDEIKTIFSEHEIGESVTVTIERDGKTKDLNLILTEYAPSSDN